MENSIENIWKQGFVDNNALVAPKVNDLYNKKSNNIIDKMMVMIKWNIIGIFLFAFAFLIYSILSGIPIVPATVIFVMFVAAGWYTKNQRDELKNIDKNVSSYEYLKSFNQWLQAQLSRNVTLSRFFYPTSFLAACSIIWFADGRAKIVAKLLAEYPNHYMVGEMPIGFLLFMTVGSLLFIVFAKHIYSFDVKLVYGRVFKKLNEIIADLEELRG